jgi:hypothetical protein
VLLLLPTLLHLHSYAAAQALVRLRLWCDMTPCARSWLSSVVRLEFTLLLLLPPYILLRAAAQALVRLRLWCDVPADKAASGLEVELPLPGHVARVHCEVDAPGSAALAGWEFSDETHMLRWRFKKVSGETVGCLV